MDSLKHLGTLKGQVIKTIAVDGLRQWGEIRDALGFTDAQLRPLIKDLKSEGFLEEKHGGLWLDYDLWLGYQAHYGDEWAINKIADLKEEQEEQERRLTLRKKRESETHLVRRFQEWITFKKLDIKPDCSHVYLKGELLETILCDLVPLAKKKILIVNPYVEKCSLCDLIISTSQRGIDIKLITRSPKIDFEGRRKKSKILFHKTLKDSDVNLYYRGFRLTSGFAVSSPPRLDL